MKDIYWLVLLRSASGRPIPLVNEVGEVVVFDTKDEAEEAATTTASGAKRWMGFKLVRWEYDA